MESDLAGITSNCKPPRRLLPLGVPEKVGLLPLVEFPAELLPFIFSPFTFLFLLRFGVSIDKPLVRLIPLFAVPDKVRLFSMEHTDQTLPFGRLDYVDEFDPFP